MRRCSWVRRTGLPPAAAASRWRVLEAVRTGVHLTTLEAATDADILVALRDPSLVGDRRDAVSLRIPSEMGKEYDFWLDERDDERIFCSKLVARLFAHLPIEPAAERPFLTLPDDIARLAVAPDPSLSLVILLGDEGPVAGHPARASVERVPRTARSVTPMVQPVDRPTRRVIELRGQAACSRGRRMRRSAGAPGAVLPRLADGGRPVSGVRSGRTAIGHPARRGQPAGNRPVRAGIDRVRGWVGGAGSGPGRRPGLRSVRRARRVGRRAVCAGHRSRARRASRGLRRCVVRAADRPSGQARAVAVASHGVGHPAVRAAGCRSGAGRRARRRSPPALRVGRVRRGGRRACLAR